MPAEVIIAIAPQQHGLMQQFKHVLYVCKGCLFNGFHIVQKVLAVSLHI